MTRIALPGFWVSERRTAALVTSPAKVAAAAASTLATRTVSAVAVNASRCPAVRRSGAGSLTAIDHLPAVACPRAGRTY